MAYSKIDDLLDEFNPDDLARLTGDSSGQQINVVRVDYARGLAEAEIDSYLAGRYKTGEDNPPDPLLHRISVDLTVYNLFQFAYARTDVPNTIIWRRMAAIDLLAKLQAGAITLVTQFGKEETPPLIRTNNRFNERTFGDDLLNKFSEREQ
jgi:phage gp36-like protein